MPFTVLYLAFSSSLIIAIRDESENPYDKYLSALCVTVTIVCIINRMCEYYKEFLQNKMQSRYNADCNSKYVSAKSIKFDCFY